MFTICEPSLLAQPHTLCAMSTAAANCTDIQAGRFIHKTHHNTLSHSVCVCVCAAWAVSHTHTHTLKTERLPAGSDKPAFVPLPEKYQIKAWRCFERQDVGEVRVRRLERRCWRRTLGMREAGCVGSLLQWSRSKLQVTWRSFGPGGVFIYTHYKRNTSNMIIVVSSGTQRGLSRLCGSWNLEDLHLSQVIKLDLELMRARRGPQCSAHTKSLSQK